MKTSTQQILDNIASIVGTPRGRCLVPAAAIDAGEALLVLLGDGEPSPDWASQPYATNLIDAMAANRGLIRNNRTGRVEVAR